MITETTAISCAVWWHDPMTLVAVVLAGTNVFSLAGWWFADWCARRIAFEAHGIAKAAREIAGQRDTWRELFDKAQLDLDVIYFRRSEATRQGNLTRSANRKAAITATTNQLQREVAERAPKLRRAA